MRLVQPLRPNGVCLPLTTIKLMEMALFKAKLADMSQRGRAGWKLTEWSPGLCQCMFHLGKKSGSGLNRQSEEKRQQALARPLSTLAGTLCPCLTELALHSSIMIQLQPVVQLLLEHGHRPYTACVNISKRAVFAQPWPVTEAATIPGNGSMLSSADCNQKRATGGLELAPRACSYLLRGQHPQKAGRAPS